MASSSFYTTMTKTVCCMAAAGVGAVVAVEIVAWAAGAAGKKRASVGGASENVGIIGRPKDPGMPFWKQAARAGKWAKARRAKKRAELMASREPRSSLNRRMRARGFHGGPTYGGVRRRRVFMEARDGEQVVLLRRELRELRRQIRKEKREKRLRK